MEILRQYIKREKINQSELAAMIGAHRNQVSYWINGKKRPGLSALKRISDATGLDIGKLIASLDDAND